MGGNLDPIRDFPTFADPYHTVGPLGIGAPDCAVGVEADAVGGDHHAIRKEELVGDDRCTTILADEDNDTRFNGLCFRIDEVVANVSHVQTASCIDDAIAQAKHRETANVGSLFQFACRLAINLPMKRVANHDCSLGSESEGIRDEWHFQYRCHTTRGVHRLDAFFVDVDEP